MLPSHVCAIGFGAAATSCGGVQSKDIGFRVAFEEDSGEDAEDWDDVLEETEDPWMREPACVLRLSAHI